MIKLIAENFNYFALIFPNNLNLAENERGCKGVVGVRVQSFKEWMADEDAQRAKISDAVQGIPG